MNILVQTSDDLVSYSFDFKTKASFEIDRQPNKIIAQNTQLVMLYDDEIKFYKIEPKRFTNSTCSGVGKYVDITYDTKKPGMFWVKDTEGKVTGFLDN